MAALARTDLPPYPRFQLAPAFGLVGFVGGLLVDAATYDEIPLPIPISLVTAFTCAVFGAWLTHLQRTRPAKATLPTFVVGVFVAGAVNGALCFARGFPFGSLFGAFLGLFVAVPFLPALGFIFGAAGEVGRARFGTHADRADRSGVFSAVAVVLAICSYSSVLARHRHLGLVLASCAVLGFVFALAACARTLHGYWVVCRAADRVGQGALFDFGVGADLLADPETEDYRGVLPQRRKSLGDPTLATARLRAALQRDVATLIATTIITAAHAVHLLPR